MRQISSYMSTLLANAGPFIGEDRAHARVTVEKDWSLHLESNLAVPDPTKLPFRWWQRLDNTQVETEVPNIKSISWDRAVDSDAASCNIELYNVESAAVAQSTRRVGRPGYLSWRPRGATATARWEAMPADWVNVLIPNALLRTYEGFGGHDKTIPEAVADGNLVLTGVWLIDDVGIGTGGTVTISCRDTCKLLIEQQMYLPLMPNVEQWYPLQYAKWDSIPFSFPAAPVYNKTNPIESGPGAEGPKWVPEIALSSDGKGYGILGTDGGVFAYNTPFFGSRGRGAIGNAVSIAAMPPDAAVGRPSGTGYWVATVAGEVLGLGTAVGLGDWGGTPDATIVAIVATHTGLGYWLLSDEGEIDNHGDALFIEDFPTSAAPIVDMAVTPTSAGYWLLAEDGAVFAYGDAVYHGNAPVGVSTAVGIASMGTNGYVIAAASGAVFAPGLNGSTATYHGGAVNPAAPIVDIETAADASGYWLLGQDGGIFAFDVPFQGSELGGDPVRAMARADEEGNSGYWVVNSAGRVIALPAGVTPWYGDAVGTVDAAPMRGFDMDPLGRGYWMASEDGAVFALGEVGYYGGANTGPLSAPVIRLVATSTGEGYWLLGADGGIFGFGDATFFGSAVGVISGLAVDMAALPDDSGYWILNELGHVYAYGDAAHYGNAPVTAPDKAAGIATHAPVVSGEQRMADGYWIATEKGNIYSLGGAPNVPAPAGWATAKANLADVITSIDPMPSGNGYILVGGDGGVFNFGDAPFVGSLPEAYIGSTRIPGNYNDFTDIIKDLLLWSGWLLYGTNSYFGNLETSGTYAEEAFGADVFDKKPVIDGINAVKEIIGFHFWIDEEGGARFESPNWFSYGNFYQENGVHTTNTHVLDERVLLTDYKLSYTDRPVRSEIIVTSGDPTIVADTTITARRIPSNPLIATLTRGMVRPAMIVVPLNVSATEQQIMAEQIEVYMTFALLQGSVTCVAHPALQINDQVRIYEEVSGETEVHYIRGISSMHDLETGVWTYQLTTNRFGT